MRYLFLILTLLGLATFGDVNRGPAVGAQATAPQPALTLTTESAAAEGIVAAFDDGTPMPRRH